MDRWGYSRCTLGTSFGMDGESVMDNAGGVVNCQSFVGFMEKFSIRMWISFSSPFPFPFPPLYLQLTLPSKHKILKREGWCPGKWANQIRSFVYLFVFFLFLLYVYCCVLFYFFASVGFSWTSTLLLRLILYFGSGMEWSSKLKLENSFFFLCFQNEFIIHSYQMSRRTPTWVQVFFCSSCRPNTTITINLQKNIHCSLVFFVTNEEKRRRKKVEGKRLTRHNRCTGRRGGGDPVDVLQHVPPHGRHQRGLPAHSDRRWQRQLLQGDPLMGAILYWYSPLFFSPSPAPPLTLTLPSPLTYLYRGHKAGGGAEVTGM